MNMLGAITNLVKEYADVDPAELTRQTDPVRDLHLNSYDMMSLIGRLEADLGVEISERDVRRLVTLGDLDDYIRAKLQS
ncbi:MAG TPA: acyl carrier protein [Propionicimonas sp.]|nr:acyl carrier protein [Propionicimonas sp.]HRA05353.1 acyl carrier protein [Propionicimonas sp.]